MSVPSDSSSHDVGRTLTYGPIPLIEEDTTFVGAGPLEIGWSNRQVVRDAIERDPETLARILRGAAARGVTDTEAWLDGLGVGGFAIHVRDAATHQEYLRFDCFDRVPHYHYIEEPNVKQTIVGFDVDANGPMFPWVLERIRRHLPAMLTRAGRPDLAARVDGDDTAVAVDGLLRAVGAVEAAGAEA